MKICMLTTSFPSYKGEPVAPFIYQLSKHLAQKVQLDVICPRNEKAQKEEQMEGVKVHRFNYFYPVNLQKLTKKGGIPSNLKTSFLAKLQFPLLFLSFLKKSKKYAKRSDVIHCQWSFTALAGIVLKKWYKKPLIMTERGSSAYLAIQNKITKKVLKYILKESDVVTANNKHQLQLFQSLGVKKEKLKYTPNGIDMQHFKPKNKNKCRKQLKLALNKKIILYVGRLVEIKGPDYLLKAMKQIKDEKVHCYIIGEGNWKTKLKNYVRENNLQNKITFLGTKLTKEIPTYINAADIIVLPSRSEGKPNIVGEALACGVPVVANDILGAKEYFREYSYGILTNAKEEKIFAKALQKALTKNWKTKKYKELLLKFRKTSTWEMSAEIYEKLYKQLILHNQDQDFVK